VSLASQAARSRAACDWCDRVRERSAALAGWRGPRGSAPTLGEMVTSRQGLIGAARRAV